MPVVNLGVTEKQYGFLCRVAEERNKKNKKGDPEFRVSDIAGEIFVPALEKEMKSG